jgi:hypothetical protein
MLPCGCSRNSSVSDSLSLIGLNVAKNPGGRGFGKFVAPTADILERIRRLAGTVSTSLSSFMAHVEIHAGCSERVFANFFLRI